jgi:hypothetical protein
MRSVLQMRMLATKLPPAPHLIPRGREIVLERMIKSTVTRNQGEVSPKFYELQKSVFAELRVNRHKIDNMFASFSEEQALFAIKDMSKPLWLLAFFSRYTAEEWAMHFLGQQDNPKLKSLRKK